MGIDNFFRQWYESNKRALASRGFNSFEDLVSYNGLPSESAKNYSEARYFEELQHVINNCEEELGIPFPPEVMQYGLSAWLGNQVPINHPLITDSARWLQVYHDSEYDSASPADEKQLWMLIYNSAGEELRGNIGTYQDLSDHVDSPDITGHVYFMRLGEQIVRFVVSKEVVAFMDEDEAVKVFDFDGNRHFKDEDLPKVKNFVLGAKGMAQGTTTNELASLIGNTLAGLIIGEDGISILDLP
jgi:hypothetical protein